MIRDRAWLLVGALLLLAIAGLGYGVSVKKTPERPRALATETAERAKRTVVQPVKAPDLVGLIRYADQRYRKRIADAAAPLTVDTTLADYVFTQACKEGDIDPDQPPAVERQGGRQRAVWCGYHTRWCDTLSLIEATFLGPSYVCEVGGFYICGLGTRESPVAYDDVPTCKAQDYNDTLAYAGRRNGLYYGGSDDSVSDGYARIKDFQIVNGQACFLGENISGDAWQPVWGREVGPWSGIPLSVLSSIEHYTGPDGFGRWVPKFRLDLRDSTRDIAWGQWDTDPQLLEDIIYRR